MSPDCDDHDPCTADSCDSVSGCVNTPLPDADGDGICDDQDPCPHDPDNDVDNDGVCGDVDNCPDVANPGQEDGDDDGTGDACETDSDGDGVPDDEDNCPNDSNPRQADADDDGIGNACDDEPFDDVSGLCPCDMCPTDLEDLEELGIPGVPGGHDYNKLVDKVTCNYSRDWKNHGEFVSCVTHVTNFLKSKGQISNSEKGNIQSDAARSKCGRKEHGHGGHRGDGGHYRYNGHYWFKGFMGNRGYQGHDMFGGHDGHGGHSLCDEH
jgi:hypothetical protein